MWVVNIRRKADEREILFLGCLNSGPVTCLTGPLTYNCLMESFEKGSGLRNGQEQPDKWQELFTRVETSTQTISIAVQNCVRNAPRIFDKHDADELSLFKTETFSLQLKTDEMVVLLQKAESEAREAGDLDKELECYNKILQLGQKAYEPLLQISHSIIQVSKANNIELPQNIRVIDLVQDLTKHANIVQDSVPLLRRRIEVLSKQEERTEKAVSLTRTFAANLVREIQNVERSAQQIRQIALSASAEPAVVEALTALSETLYEHLKLIDEAVKGAEAKGIQMRGPIVEADGA